ncbi:DUF4123 domain-containing protein [Paucimonas lemoignei]|nr:DUF4123 domain-containing protein [Paucimonas lemoignei]
MSHHKELLPAPSPLTELLHKDKHSDANPYLLADGARLLKYQIRGTLPLHVHLGTSLAVFDDITHQAHAVGPLLFDLDWSAWEQSRRFNFLETLFLGDVCSFLLSPLSRQELAHHLHHHLDVILEDGSEMLMRFYDPRVLASWYQILPTSQRQDLGLGITAWGYFDHQQQVCWLPIEKKRNEFPEKAYPFQITAQQEEALLRQCLPYTLLDRLLLDASSGLDTVKRSQRYQILATLIQKSQKYGFDGMANLENFCRLGLQYGVDFDQMQPMQRLLGQTNKPAHLDELLTQFSTKDWEAMKAFDWVNE